MPHVTTTPSPEKWFATATLLGGGAVFADAYPVCRDHTTEHVGVVRCQLKEPVQVASRFGQLFQQEVVLETVAATADVQELMHDALRAIADVVSVACMERVEYRLPAIKNAATGNAAKTIPIMESDRSPRRLVKVPARALAGYWEAVATNPAHGPRILRAVRWLRRSIGALDSVEEFTVVAFGLEAISIALPAPSSSWLKTVRSRKTRSKAGSPTESELLRHFACEVLAAPSAAWKLVGGLRHELFHGGLTEDSDSHARLSEVVPIARLVLVRAIEHAIGFRMAPFQQAPVPFVIGSPTFVFGAPLEFQPPKAELSDRPSLFEPGSGIAGDADGGSDQ